MSNVYTLYLNSNNRINGSNNNNAIYNINWANFLPTNSLNKQYSVSYSFLSTGGFYKDTATNFYSIGKIYIDFGCGSKTYSTECNGPSKILGLISRDVQSASASSNYFSAFFNQHPSIIMQRPTQNIITVTIYNTFSNILLVNTDNIGNVSTDMTSYNLIIQFTEV